MATDEGGLRIYKPNPIDVLIENPGTVDPSKFETDRFISIREIKKFCGGCDHFKQEENTCRKVEADDQATAVHRKWCGYASIGGHREIRRG